MVEGPPESGWPPSGRAGTLSTLAMEMDLLIPGELRQACSDRSLVGDYLLSIPEDWFQPHDAEGVDLVSIDRDFDGTTTTKEGLLVGAIRICSTGCEGYHIYVFRGPFAGEIWSDQRVSFGSLTRIADTLSGYLEVLRNHGKSHIQHWEKLR